MVKPSVVPSHSTSTICPSLLRTIPSVYIGLSLAYSLPNREVKIFTRSKGCIPVSARFPVFSSFSYTTTDFDFGQSQSLRILLSLIIFSEFTPLTFVRLFFDNAPRPGSSFVSSSSTLFKAFRIESFIVPCCTRNLNRLISSSSRSLSNLKGSGIYSPRSSG